MKVLIKSVSFKQLNTNAQTKAFNFEYDGVYEKIIYVDSSYITTSLSMCVHLQKHKKELPKLF